MYEGLAKRVFGVYRLKIAKRCDPVSKETIKLHF